MCEQTVKVDFAVAVAVCLADHGVNVVIAQCFAEVGHRLAQFLGVDQTVAVDVEHAERLPQFRLLTLQLGFFVVACCRCQPPRHHHQKLFELHRAVPCRRTRHIICIDLWFVGK